MALGRSVAELNETVTRAEMLEWQAFYAIEPFGYVRADIHAAQVCQTISAIASAFGGGTPGSLSDYMLKWDGPEKEEKKSSDTEWKAARSKLRGWSDKNGH